jgi:hypothetical protein
MSPFLLYALHYFFLVFHTVLILFNLFGWLHPKTKKWHLLSLFVTLFSWIILGIWKGFGYCFLTDWHYQVLYQMGERNLPYSYISYLVHTLSGWMPPVVLVDTLTLVFTIAAFVCSLWMNVRKWKR